MNEIAGHCMQSDFHLSSQSGDCTANNMWTSCLGLIQRSMQCPGLVIISQRLKTYTNVPQHTDQEAPTQDKINYNYIHFFLDVLLDVCSSLIFTAGKSNSSLGLVLTMCCFPLIFSVRVKCSCLTARPQGHIEWFAEPRLFDNNN